MKMRAVGTDFFDRQERAQRRTWHLLTLFLLVFLFLCAGTYLVLALVTDLLLVLWIEKQARYFFPFFTGEGGLDWTFAAYSVGLTALVVGSGSLQKILSLRSGGAAVAESVGGREVFRTDSDWRVRRFINVVEEMSLASGVPTPRIYVLPAEHAINGFAAGFSVNDAALAVTEGALKYLSRDELQALVAHEFSHILYGDMRLNIWLLGLLSGVMGIYLTGDTVVEIAKDAGREGTNSYFAAQAALAGHIYGFVLGFPGYLLKLIGLGGLLGSRMIKAGVSRQREFLADASAVQFTRNPDALIRALAKIGGCDGGSQLRGAGLEAVSHMCFGEASSTGLTHPSLEARILAIDPHYNVDQGFAVLGPDDEQGAGDEAVHPGQGGKSYSEGPLQDLLGHFGEASPVDLAYSMVLLERLPQELQEGRTSLAGAIAIAYLLLINGEGPHKKEQARLIETRSGRSVAEEARRLWPVVSELDEALRLPLMDLLFARLRQMTREQYERFEEVAKELIQLDGEVSFQEFILERLLLGRLKEAMDPSARRGVQFHSFSGVRRDLEHLLSAMAYAGAQDPQEVARAFELGRQQIPGDVGAELELRERSRWDYETIAVAMERLAISSVAIRRAAIEACAHCVMADGRVVVAEAELLRAVSSILGVPIPPIVPV